MGVGNGAKSFQGSLNQGPFGHPRVSQEPPAGQLGGPKKWGTPVN